MLDFEIEFGTLAAPDIIFVMGWMISREVVLPYCAWCKMWCMLIVRACELACVRVGVCVSEQGPTCVEERPLGFATVVTWASRFGIPCWEDSGWQFKSRGLCDANKHGWLLMSS